MFTQTNWVNTSLYAMPTIVFTRYVHVTCGIKGGKSTKRSETEVGKKMEMGKSATRQCIGERECCERELA